MLVTLSNYNVGRNKDGVMGLKGNANQLLLVRPCQLNLFELVSLPTAAAEVGYRYIECK